MNKIFKYTLISSLSLILFVCFYFIVLITNNGLSVNFLKPYFNGKLSDKFENYSLDFEKGLLIYSASTGLQFNINNFIVFLDGKENEIEINKLEFPISCIFQQLSNKRCNIKLDEINFSNPIYGLVSKFKADTSLDQSMASIELDNPLKNGFMSIQNLSGIIETIDMSVYSIDVGYLHDDKKIILNKFMGNNIFLIDRGFINFDNLNNELKLKLNFSINPKILHSKLFNFSEQILNQLDNLIGWQNMNLDTTLNNFDIYNLNTFVLAENSKVSMDGMYEMDFNLVEDFFYDQSYLSDYKITLLKDKKINKLIIHELKNDIIFIEDANITFDNLSFISGKANIPINIEKDIVLGFFERLFSSNDSYNARIISLLETSLVEKQKVFTSFSFNFKGNKANKIFKDTSITLEGPLNINYVFDDNEIPNEILGKINYKFNLYNLEKPQVNFDGEINFNDSEAYIRQINLAKVRGEALDIKFKGLFDQENDSLIKFNSIGSSVNLKGKIRLSSDNHLYLDQIVIDNSDNVKLTINGDLSKKVLNMTVEGDIIDLSQNKIENRKIKKSYLNKEFYKISTQKVIFNENVQADNFKATINKEKSTLNVYSGATNGASYLKYTREKNEYEDTNIIYSNNISDFVNEDHAAYKLLSDGDIQMISVRNLETLKANVDIKLNDFVLINSPASLKLLSLPSISGLVSIAEGEQGIRFGYGDIKYVETDKNFENIEAFAVSDSLGLVMDGSINRGSNSIDMKGEISPLHLINAIIQNVPVLGNILVGNEGEGLFSIDFRLFGNSEDPEVESNPLTIIKPRILERAGEFLQNLDGTNQE